MCLEGLRQRDSHEAIMQNFLKQLSHALIHARHGFDVQSEKSNN